MFPRPKLLWHQRLSSLTRWSKPIASSLATLRQGQAICWACVKKDHIFTYVTQKPLAMQYNTLHGQNTPSQFWGSIQFPVETRNSVWNLQNWLDVFWVHVCTRPRREHMHKNSLILSSISIVCVTWRWFRSEREDTCTAPNCPKYIKSILCGPSTFELLVSHYITANSLQTRLVCFVFSLFYAFLDVSCHPECSEKIFTPIVFQPKFVFNELWEKQGATQCYQAF